MELTVEDRAVLAHVVVDPDAWLAHALATVGEEAVVAKIERHRASYEEASTDPGYTTRAVRQAEAAAAERARVDAVLAESAERAALIEAALTQRKADAAVSLNNPVIRGTQEQRDAFARLIGVLPLEIALDIDATSEDVFLT